MQMLSERRPTVHVYRCPPFDLVQLGGEPNASQSTLRFAHTTVDALIAASASFLRSGMTLDWSVTVSYLGCAV